MADQIYTTESEVVSSASGTSDATLVSVPCRVRGLYVRAAGTAGTIVLKDGGSSGTAKITINTPAAVSGVYIPIPGAGVAFATDCYLDVTTADGCTIFYSS